MTSKIKVNTNEPSELPEFITFISTGEEAELTGDVWDVEIKKEGKVSRKIRTKSSSGTYTYTKVPIASDRYVSKKLNTTVDLSLEYLQRLNMFGLIKFSFKNEG